MIVVLPAVSPSLDSSQLIYSVCHHSQRLPANSPTVSTANSMVVPRDYAWATIVMMMLLTLVTLMYIIFFKVTYNRKAAENNQKFSCWHAYRLENVSPVVNEDSEDSEDTDDINLY